jgi:hypothetical protein
MKVHGRIPENSLVRVDAFQIRFERLARKACVDASGCHQGDGQMIEVCECAGGELSREPGWRFGCRWSVWSLRLGGRAIVGNH